MNWEYTLGQCCLLLLFITLLSATFVGSLLCSPFLGPAQVFLTASSKPTWDSWVLRAIPEANGSPWGPGWCLFSADFNENGFIDEEDLQRIVLRLLNSDDVSEDLLSDLTSHVSTWSCTGWGGSGCHPNTKMAGRARCPEGWAHGRKEATTSLLSVFPPDQGLLL